MTQQKAIALYCLRRDTNQMLDTPERATVWVKDEAVFACKRCQRLGRNYMTWIKREDWNGLGYAYFNELTQHAQAYAAPFCARCRADYSRISYRRKHVAPYEPAF